MIVKIDYEFSVEISVFGYPELKTVILENVCMFVPSSIVKANEPILAECTPNMYCRSTYGRGKLF